jgi:hypothetical protein
MTDAEEKEPTKEEIAEIVDVLKENGRRFRAQMVAEGMPMPMPVDLTDDDIEHAVHEAHEIISMYPWPVIWAIGAVLGWKDALGGAEYRRETAAREREEADANARY